MLILMDVLIVFMLNVLDEHWMRMRYECPHNYTKTHKNAKIWG
jgi:hypothetical protein